MKRSLILIVLIGLTSVVQAAKQQLTCGDPTADGTYGFRLNAPDGSSITVTRAIAAADTDVDKATKIANLINMLPGGDWKANRDGAKLTFQHKENGEFKDVSSVQDIEDDSGEPDRWDALAAAGGIFDFGISDGLAAGVDALGGQSILVCSTNVGGHAIFITTGRSAHSLIDELFADLNNDGVSLQRTSPLTFRISAPVPNAFIKFQLTDSALRVDGAGAIASTGVPSLTTYGLIILALLLAGTAVWMFRRRRVSVA